MNSPTKLRAAVFAASLSAATCALAATAGADAPAAAILSPGETLAPSPQPTGDVPTASATPSKKAAPVASKPADIPAGLGYDAGAGVAEPHQEAERVVYQRAAPIRVVMAPGVERLVTFPAPIALRTPEGFEQLVQVQIIERTAYLRPVAPFSSLRVVAEDLSTGRQIPIDLVADVRTSKALATRPIEVMVPSASRVVAGGAEAQPEASPARSRAPEVPALDMVALTRFAAQSLYAPRRLVPAVQGVQQVPVTVESVEGLYRGWKLETTPIAAWRSGGLYVTAVRFTNLGAQVLDIDLQELRGAWTAATAQHNRLLSAGSDWDTTTVYLVCERPFEACR